MNHRRPFYGQDAFAHNAARGECRCPSGPVLARERINHTQGVIVNRDDSETCNACPVKDKCTASHRGRIVYQSLYAEYLEKVHAYHAKNAVRTRQVWVEPLFAEAKLWHGLRRFQLRGLANVNIEGLLIAAGQNVKRFLAATGWGRRHTPVRASSPFRWSSGGSQPSVGDDRSGRGSEHR
jgi:hypothetical protein